MKPAFTRAAIHPLALSALAGLLLVLSFEPAGLALLAPVGFAMLALQWHKSIGPLQAALRGYAFGLAFFGAGVSWIYVSLHTFGMMPAMLAALATALFCAFLALFPAGVGYVQARLRAPPLAGLLLAVPGVWVLAEWLRGWIFTGFPWLSLGYSQAQAPLAGYAPLFGVFGVSLVTALCGSLLAVLWARAEFRRSHRIAAAAAIIALAGLGWGLREHAWTQPSGAAIRVALAQGNVPQSLKFEPGRYEATLTGYRKLVERSTAPLVILPETAIPRFLHEVDERYLEDLQDLMQARKGDLLLGAPLRGRSGGYYNSVVSVGSSRTQAYSKVHLVPFGEFIPPGFGWILNVLHIPLSDFTRGRADQRPLALAGRADLRVAVNICYEDAFGEEIARQLPEATLLANVSNVAWFGDSLAPDQHMQISQMRAIETGRYMLRATNSGVTAIIDERGRVAARLPKFTEGLLEGNAQPFTGSTPYVRFGDSSALAASLALCIAAGIISLARMRRRPSSAS